MTGEIKMGFEMLLKVKRSGHSTYLVIPGEVAGNYLLEPGDLVRVELKTAIRKIDVELKNKNEPETKTGENNPF